ncbi:MAG: response regulator receiver domain [Ruminococcus flavefaciens]|nr:response regulator receiver domain [Ruminococcus flavefaciens]
MNNDEFSKEYFQPTVNKYLSTVLCIDDQFNYEEISAISLKSVSQGAETIDEESIKNNNQFDNNRTIRVNELVKSFCKKQLLVTPINPKDLNTDNVVELKNTIFALAQKSDVIILDREISGIVGMGGQTLSNEIIEELANDGRYHYLIIYTADDPEKVETELTNAGKFSHTNIDIKVKGKVGINGMSYDELAEFVCSDYMKSKNGLLAGALIESLTKLRTSSALMLNKLSKDYDKAFICHRILLTKPDKSLDFLFDIIRNEISSYMDSESLGSYWKSDCIKAYIQSEQSLNLTIKKDKNNTVENSELFKLIEDGIESNVFSKNVSTDIQKGKKIDYILGDDDTFAKKFSEYTSILSKSEVPNLKTGCIIQYNNHSYLCMQPLCDTERIPQKNTEENISSSPAPFLFVELKEMPTDNDRKIDFYFTDRNTLNGFKVVYSQVAVFYFFGNKNGVIPQNSKKYTGYIYQDIGKEVAFEYIACLKPMVAQKFLNNFASNISRVGIDQFEWLRLKGRE